MDLADKNRADIAHVLSQQRPARAVSVLTASIVEPQLVKDRELAAITGLKFQGLKKHRIRGSGPPFVRRGRAVFYDLDAVRQWFAQRQPRTRLP